MNRGQVVDYRKLRLKNLNSPEFSHLKLLLYWPIFGILFYLVERVFLRDEYFVMYCPLDEYIPFLEWFVIPYFFWFIFLIGIHVYTLLFDVDAFRRLMYYIIITYTVSLVIFMIFPNCQAFRPRVLPRENVLTDIVAWLYSFDTNTNVCPSLHVVGSSAVMFAAWDSRHFSTRGWKIAFAVAALIISISTIFLRQHSVLDLLAAVPVCMLGHYAVYGKQEYRQKKVVSRW